MIGSRCIWMVLVKMFLQMPRFACAYDVSSAVHTSIWLDRFVLDLQLSDLPAERPDLIDGIGSAAESIAPVLASDRSVAQAIGTYLAAFDQAVSALSVDAFSYVRPVSGSCKHMM